MLLELLCRVLTVGQLCHAHPTCCIPESVKVGNVLTPNVSSSANYCSHAFSCCRACQCIAMKNMENNTQFETHGKQQKYEQHGKTDDAAAAAGAAACCCCCCCCQLSSAGTAKGYWCTLLFTWDLLFKCDMLFISW